MVVPRNVVAIEHALQAPCVEAIPLLNVVELRHEPCHVLVRVTDVEA